MRKADARSRNGIRPDEVLEELAPILKALPQGTHVACIQEGDDLHLYNITKALELFGSRPATASIDVAEQVTHVQPRNADALEEDKALVDPDHAAGVDVSYPIMLVESRSEVGGDQGRVIDGWHRIYRPAQLGIAELPAVVITAEEEALIRIESGF